MQIEPGKFRLITFGPGPVPEVAEEVNKWIEKHDLARYPIVSQSNQLTPVPGDPAVVVLTYMFAIMNVPDEPAATPGNNGQIQRVPPGVRLSDIH